jgi:hypothetical protein
LIFTRVKILSSSPSSSSLCSLSFLTPFLSLPSFPFHLLFLPTFFPQWLKTSTFQCVPCTHILQSIASVLHLFWKYLFFIWLSLVTPGFNKYLLNKWIQQISTIFCLFVFAIFILLG